MLGNVKRIRGKPLYFDQNVFSDTWNLKIAQFHGVPNNSIWLVNRRQKWVHHGHVKGKSNNKVLIAAHSFTFPF